MSMLYVLMHCPVKTRLVAEQVEGMTKEVISRTIEKIPSLAQQDVIYICDVPLWGQGWHFPYVILGACSEDAPEWTYLNIPISRHRLLGRLKLMQRMWVLGPYIICPENDQAYAPEYQKLVTLREKEAALLEALYACRGAYVPKEKLLEKVWGYGPEIDTRTLAVHVHQLRTKLVCLEGKTLIHSNDVGYAVFP